MEITKLRQIKNPDVATYRQRLKNEKFLRCLVNDDLTSGIVYEILVAGNEVVGYIGVDKYEDLTLCIFGIYIAPPFRRKGLATAAIKKIINQYKMSNKIIYGLVDIENIAAINCYNKYYGFLGKDKTTLWFYSEKYKNNLLIREGNYQVIFYNGK